MNNGRKPRWKHVKDDFLYVEVELVLLVAAHVGVTHEVQGVAEIK